MTIVGWDDAFSAANFRRTAAGDGAWLIKNSWGSSWGTRDTSTSRTTTTGQSASRPATWVPARVAFTASTSTTRWDGSIPRLSSGATPTVAWAANDFTAASSDPITVVGFYTPVADAQYGLYTAATHGGTRTSQGSGTLSRAGYHTVALSSPLAVTTGQGFSIILKLTTPGYNWPVVVEYAAANYSSQATSAAGQSFMSPDGTSWTDVGSSSQATPRNVCLKAFSTYSGTDTTPPTTTASGMPAGWATGPVTVSFSADDGAGVGVQATMARVDGDVYRQCSSILVSGEGTHTVQYYSIDNLGNAETAKTGRVSIDSTAPTTTTTVGASTSWTNVAPMVTLLANDGGSRPAVTQYRHQGASDWTAYATPFQVTTQGQSTWEYRSVDVAGNAELPKTLSVQLDSQAPSTAAFAASARTRKPVVLKYQVNDASPGCGSAAAVIRIYQGKRLKKTLKPGVRPTGVKQSYRWRWRSSCRPLHDQGLGDGRRRQRAEQGGEREAHGQVTPRAYRSEALGVAFAIDERFADVGFEVDPHLPTAHFLASVPAEGRIAALAVVTVASEPLPSEEWLTRQLARARASFGTWSPETHEMLVPPEAAELAGRPAIHVRYRRSTVPEDEAPVDTEAPEDDAIAVPASLVEHWTVLVEEREWLLAMEPWCNRRSGGTRSGMRSSSPSGRSSSSDSASPAPGAAGPGGRS